ncbi:hypothetical protein PENSOL_c011G04675 [Penicillium solitum]|uniref:Uncharacterized protein n=1 Tax=Penicillium solitum TaxID=60172 RepID=A0A1V6R8C3_9EURO|nr:uncharacterized protein PENSOL_c011G04675 [Penicillium solitum]OQD97750.1 hypothetical protein PENSOL_c011G04675 [Penicillium solitum]
MGKKRFQLKTNYTRRLVTYVGNGGLLESDKDINSPLSQSVASGLEVSGVNKGVDSNSICRLDIPGPRDVALKEYGEWQESNVTNDTLEGAFRQACDVMLEDGLDLE